MGKEEIIDLKEAQKVVITTVVDNYIDVLLTSKEDVQRPILVKDGKRKKPLLAEHGLSFVIEIEDDLEHHTIMMDFGLSSIAVPNNLPILEIDPSSVESFIISHGHHDHIGSIKEVLSFIPEPKDVIVHPHAFLETRMHIFSDGRQVPIPSLKKDAFEQTNCSIKEITSPVKLVDDYAATLTEIPRVTEFEKGLPTAYYKLNDEIYKDDIIDDQALVVNIKNKGLVVISGCGHSGIINTILYAQKITGVRKVYAIIGGFHLTGPNFEPIIDRTVEEMKKFSPEYIVPTHCTGWKAMERFSKVFPDNFVLNSVGTKIIIE
ncbi:MAG: MBL fold metallo-hydrolase [bacterium]